MIDGGAGALAGGAPSGTFDPWSYRDDAWVTGADLIGYKVEATDGGIGKIDKASHEVIAPPAIGVRSRDRIPGSPAGARPFMVLSVRQAAAILVAWISPR